MNAAHIHLMLNHIPVLGGFATLALVLLAVYRQSEAVARLALELMVFVGVVGLFVFLSGDRAEDIVEHLPRVSEAAIETHEKWALYSLISTEILAILGMAGIYSMRKFPAKIFRYWMIVLLIAVANAGLMAATAYFGGQIIHAELHQGPPGAPPR